mmetsp:Transcript_25745/g.55894  ORF Transcript_25745/g.55894 Transcript_25745/m.55894 type:complete len:94 (+) Transcript_25745:285-566(+)
MNGWKASNSMSVKCILAAFTNSNIDRNTSIPSNHPPIIPDIVDMYLCTRVFVLFDNLVQLYNFATAEISAQSMLSDCRSEFRAEVQAGFCKGF